MSRPKRKNRTPATSSPKRIVLPLWKKLIFAVATCLIFLAVAEALLALLRKNQPYVEPQRLLRDETAHPLVSSPT